jgi:hypothetical protein
VTPSAGGHVPVQAKHHVSQDVGIAGHSRRDAAVSDGPLQQSPTELGSTMAICVPMLLPPDMVFAVLGKYFSVGAARGLTAKR